MDYIWAEDTNDCPKANHTTYDMNKNIVTVLEKGKTAAVVVAVGVQ